MTTAALGLLIAGGVGRLPRVGGRRAALRGRARRAPASREDGVRPAADPRASRPVNDRESDAMVLDTGASLSLLTESAAKRWASRSSKGPPPARWASPDRDPDGLRLGADGRIGDLTLRARPVRHPPRRRAHLRRVRDALPPSTASSASTSSRSSTGWSTYGARQPGHPPRPGLGAALATRTSSSGA